MAKSATLTDLEEFFNIRRSELRDQLHVEREQYMIDCKGVHSGPTITGGVRRLEKRLQEEVASLFSELGMWVGPRLDVVTATDAMAEIARGWIAEFGRTDYAWRIGTRGLSEAEANKYLEPALHNLNLRLQARVRIFEMGIREESVSPGYTINVVNAEKVVGGIQQAGGNSTLENAVTVTSIEVREAVDRVAQVLSSSAELEEIASEMAADLATIRAQLEKDRPNSSILRESAKSIRTIAEGAVGGSLATASHPALAHAVTVLAATLGMS